MRASLRLLAKTSSSPGRPVPLNILPPIPLYRRLFRAHRKLPAQMRILGDEMIKAEFRSHQKTDNPLHIIGFLTEWQLYLQQVEGDSWREGKFDQSKFERMNDDQKVQLYELMKEIRKLDLEENDPEYKPEQ